MGFNWFYVLSIKSKTWVLTCFNHQHFENYHETHTGFSHQNLGFTPVGGEPLNIIAVQPYQWEWLVWDVEHIFLGPKPCLKPPARNGVDPDDWVDPRFGHEFIQPQPVEAKELPGMTFVLATKEEFPVLNNRNDLGTQEHIIISFKVLVLQTLKTIWAFTVGRFGSPCGCATFHSCPFTQSLWPCAHVSVTHGCCIDLRCWSERNSWNCKLKMTEPGKNCCLGQSPAFGEATKSQLVSRVIFEHIGDEMMDINKKTCILHFIAHTHTHI